MMNDRSVEEMEQLNACKMEGLNDFGVARHSTCSNALFGFYVDYV